MELHTILIMVVIAALIVTIGTTFIKVEKKKITLRVRSRQEHDMFDIAKPLELAGLTVFIARGLEQLQTDAAKAADVIIVHNSFYPMFAEVQVDTIVKDGEITTMTVSRRSNGITEETVKALSDMTQEIVRT